MKKLLLFTLFLSIVLSGCGNEIPISDLTSSNEFVSTVEETVNELPDNNICESIPQIESYTSLGISSEDVSSNIKHYFSSPIEYTFQTEQYSMNVILNEGLPNTYTQQCIIYTSLDSNEVLCVRFMDTNAVLVKSESGSKAINKCIDSVISLLDISESGYTATTCNDENFEYSFCIYPVDVDSTVLLQPQSFELSTGILQDSFATESSSDTPVISSTPETSEVPSAPETVDVTTGQKNALKQAKQYLKIMAFSYNGLINQLEFEGYTHEEAVYGAENCNADWNEQALKKAASYLQTLNFSYSGLIAQLEFDSFTSEQATFAANNCGADWNEQAAQKAVSYLSLMSFSRDSLISQLEFDGFTHDQAVYGAEANGY